MPSRFVPNRLLIAALATRARATRARATGALAAGALAAGLLAVGVTSLAPPALAVNRDLDGYARIRFGMTLDEVRAARPEGEYKADSGEYWITTERTEPGQTSPSSKFRLRVQFGGGGQVDRITNENLLAAEAKDYGECKAFFIAMVDRLTQQIGEPDSVHMLNEPEFLFGQRYRARNHAYYSFNNGAALDVYSVWDDYRIFTKMFRDISCTALADFHKP